MIVTEQIPDRLYFRIGDVAEIAGVKPYVLRYWESEFPMIAPDKSSTGQRVYRRSDVETVLMIKRLLYQERYSIEGARRRIKELRKEGELRTFKQDSATGGTNPEALEKARQRIKENNARLRELARELRGLTQTRISEIFRY
jgi:DNA-binding transcriptional MerR regulator